DSLVAALDRAQLVERLDVMVAVVVDGAVAIEDDELHAASLERSAMRFIVPCSLPRKPMRFARTRGSLSITITLSKNASTGALSEARELSAPVSLRALNARSMSGCSSLNIGDRLFSSGRTI